MQYNYNREIEMLEGRPWASFFLLMLGVFSRTKVFFLGTIAISELAIFPIAPLLFFRNFRKLRRDGFLPLIWMIVGLAIALLLSSFINQSPRPYVIKAGAVFYSLFSYVIVFHALLRNNYKSMYLFWLGFAISAIITLFGFNPTATVSDVGFEALSTGGVVEMSAELGKEMFWMDKIKTFGQVPMFGWYLKMPLVYPMCYAIVYAGTLILTTGSGRSVILTTLLAVAIMAVVGRSRRRMAKFGQHILSFVIIGLVIVLVYKAAYVFAAENRLLTDAGISKYEDQTERGSGVISMLIGGRQEMFIDFVAALDNPIFGLGPRPADKNGYAEKFLLKYGTDFELRFHEYRKKMYQHIGMSMPLTLHSIIAEFWAQYGLFGLVFWLWILYIVYCHLRRYMSAIPQWCGYFAMSISTFIWDIFFSTFASRESFACFFVCLFFARAIGQGRIMLPYDMEMEARKHE